LRGGDGIPTTMPKEIDVYKDPHTRMKKLVNSVVESMRLEILKLEPEERERTLQKVYLIMWELKTHEFIENMFIMTKLKERLSALEVYNQTVCNCHEDSSLIQIIKLVEFVYNSLDTMEANYYWNRLQTEVYAFMEEFVPHMEEEENTFQPLLCQYFDYEELKKLKETVVEQHQVWKTRVRNEKNLNNSKDSFADELKRLNKTSSYCEKLRQLSEGGQNVVEYTSLKMNDLPEEMLLHIFSFLSPIDLARAGAVCRGWRELMMDVRFWHELPLASWEMGRLDSWENPDIDPAIIETRRRNSEEDLEDANSQFYNCFIRFVRTIGRNVRRVYLGGSSLVSDQFMDTLLQNCPNLVHLDVSYSSVTDNGLKRIADLSVRHLDFSGCAAITDRTLKSLASADGKPVHLNVSGCCEVTDTGVIHLYRCNSELKFADFSGCYRLTGGVLTAFIASCPKLKAESLSYCCLIQDGPYPDDANGCQNLESAVRACCLNYS